MKPWFTNINQHLLQYAYHNFQLTKISQSNQLLQWRNWGSVMTGYLVLFINLQSLHQFLFLSTSQSIETFKKILYTKTMSQKINSMAQKCWGVQIIQVYIKIVFFAAKYINFFSFSFHAPFRSCISKIHNAIIYDAEDPDIDIVIYNLLEWSGNYCIGIRKFIKLV